VGCFGLVMMTIDGLTNFGLEGLRRSRMRRAGGAGGGLALGDGDHGFGHGKPGLHHKRGNDRSRNDGYSTSDCHFEPLFRPPQYNAVAQREVPARLTLKARRSALTLRIGRAALRTGSRPRTRTAPRWDRVCDGR
jgi:hypothetical protein